MAIKCGWAAIDENGRAKGGKAGDQTGGEVHTGNLYNFGQKYVLRFKDREKAKEAAKICEAICKNKHVGYDQGGRTTLYTELKKVGWDVSKLKTNCECDCSALMAVCCNAVGIKVSKDWYTGNMVAAARATGKFSVLTAAKYLSLTGDYLKTGDIIVAPYSHTIMALQDGSKVKKDEPKKDDPAPAKKAKAVKVGAKIKIKKGAKQYGKTKGFIPFVYERTYKVVEIRGSRVVFATQDGKTVMGAVSKADCIVQ